MGGTGVPVEKRSTNDIGLSLCLEFQLPSVLGLIIKPSARDARRRRSEGGPILDSWREDDVEWKIS